jgi:hypothetical protein
MWPAVIMLAKMISAKRPGWAFWGGTFAIFGLFARTFHAGIDHLAFQLVREQNVDLATKVIANSYGAFHIFKTFNLAIMLGWIVLAIGAYRADTIKIRLIGNTTKIKGYVDGMILFYGKVTTGTGGGLCQLSNLIYWMTLHSPLNVTERYRHSYDVFPDSNRCQPFGSGATCAYNYLDLQIKNETIHNYQLVIYLTDTHLVGEWRVDIPSTRRYKVYEKEHWITHEFWGGYVRHNKIYRKVYNIENELIDDEFITENHAIMMYEPLLSEGSS